MTTGWTPVHIGVDGHSIEGAEHLRSLRTYTGLLSALAEDMTPLAACSLPEFVAPDLVRSKVLVDTAKEALSGMEGRTEIRKEVCDTMSTEQTAELRELTQSLEDCHFKTVILVLKLEMAMALFGMGMGKSGSGTG